MQERFAVDGFVQSLIFSDEATFHLSGRVNRHNVRIWVTENLLAVVENVRDSPKPNIFCSISNEKVYGPFFFEEPTVNGMLYSHMLENWLMPQLNEDSNDYVFQQDGLSGSLLQRRARVSQSKIATKVDRTHRKRRWWVNAVATPVPGFNLVRLFLLGVLWRTLSLCSPPR